MTITYTGRVANARLGSFSRLLFHWRGSIYKLMYKEMVIFCILYATLSLIYRLALTEDHKRVFESISRYCKTFTDLIPMSFILGFYVSIVVKRWWSQYTKIPWPDRIMMYLSTCVEGDDTYGKLVRRTIVRYLTLGSIIVFQSTSVCVKKRFPTMEHIIEAGVITQQEAKELEEVDSPHGIWWIPFLWICNILKDARQKGRILDNFLFKTLLDEVMAYRGNLGDLYGYDWISVPLVYTQVTTLAVYIFFLGALFGQQFLDPTKGYPGHNVDLYVPFFTVLQFFFYMGWLKVAEQLINPFGEDDDDFEMNWIIDRNLQVSLLSVDELHNFYPKLEKDIYFDEHAPEFLPYTKSSISTKIEPHMGSTADLSVSTEGMRTINPMETIPEDILTRSNRYINHVTGINTPFTVSPQPSPSKQKRFQQNLTIGMRSPNSISKSTMEGLPVRSQSGRFHIQPANQALTCKAQSYIEHWLHRADNKQSATLQPDTPTTDGLLSRPLSLFQSVTHDDGSMVFSIDMDAPKETKSEVVPSPRQEHINFIPEKQTTDCPVRRPHIQMSSEDVRTTGEPTSGVQANSAQVAATDNSQIGEKPAECSSSDDDRSRHTSSSDGSFCYGQKNGNGLVTVSSLTPLLRDMETQLPVSNA
ncbi:hypothetical protein LSH36_146g01058 [Paralvinella palmiformis]|uniref:Bestrophin homolog n=1 Tax=Paralvinella palmiformis TaxID=53620 RepID=A0AAD9JV83_9ANNE|nr:hypothetical protein LSH36_146g01058 [Paralvinella palmiformis]